MFQYRPLTAVALLLALSACSRKQPAPAVPAPEPQAQDAATANAENRPQPATAATAAAQSLVGEVHEFMTSQLGIFIQQNGRLPKDFAEFSRARLDSVPRTPVGMKWAIDTTTREVKLVKE
jgi:hypothetical protein